MIRPIDFIWKQLNGPQITAIIKSFHDWCTSQFDATLEYFDNLSLDTASHSHLTLMGQIANLARPFVSIPDKNFFWFTAQPQKNFEHGFSSIEERGVGGKFIDIQKLYDTYHGEPLTDEFFRILLKTYTNSEGEDGSLRLMDDVVDALRKVYATDKKAYKFTIVEEPETNKDYGDLYIDLGIDEEWNSWEQVIVSIKAIASTMYYPLPRVYPEYTAKDPVIASIVVGIEDSTLNITTTGSYTASIEDGTLNIVAPGKTSIEDDTLNINKG